MSLGHCSSLCRYLTAGPHGYQHAACSLQTVEQGGPVYSRSTFKYAKPEGLTELLTWHLMHVAGTHDACRYVFLDVGDHACKLNPLRSSMTLSLIMSVIACDKGLWANTYAHTMHQ